MFICGHCRASSEPREKKHVVVVEKFRGIFHYRKKIYKYYDEEDNFKTKWKDDPGGEGWQIKREMSLCDSCYRIFDKTTVDRQFPPDRKKERVKRERFKEEDEDDLYPGLRSKK